MAVRKPLTDGFTVLELLIVATLLLILAATFVPEFTAAHEDARFTAVKDDLAMLRKQIELYRTQHHGRFPAQGTSSDELFLSQLQHRTDPLGTVSARGKYGPYLSGSFPRSPYQNTDQVVVIAGPLLSEHTDGTGSHAWAFSSTTGEIRANVSEKIISPTGQPIRQL